MNKCSIFFASLFSFSIYICLIIIFSLSVSPKKKYTSPSPPPLFYSLAITYIQKSPEINFCKERACVYMCINMYLYQEINKKSVVNKGKMAYTKEKDKIDI